MPDSGNGFFNKNKTTKNLLINLLLAFFSLITFFGFAEFLARQYISLGTYQTNTPYEYDAQKLFALKPNWEGHFLNDHIKTNMYGHQDREVLPRSQVSFRILLTGDSVSFSPLNRKTWDEYLEKWQEIDIINTAVGITPADDAFHGSTKRFSAEWWYFDAIFKNDYSIHIGFRTLSKKTLGIVTLFLEIYKGGKLTIEKNKRFLFKNFK